MPISLIETLCQGGCYWKRDREDSPGHSFVLPNATRFKIAIEGPQSSRFIEGVCRDSYFLVREGTQSGVQFASANEAVNTVREPSSNAFLHMHFLIDGHWQSADDVRQSQASRLDAAEELALEDALRIVRSSPKSKDFDFPKVLRAAARLVAKRPTMIEDARRRLASPETLTTFEDLFRE